MERRLAGVRATMGELDLQAVLFTSYHNIDYYSDFLFTHFGRLYGLMVTPDTQTSISANITIVVIGTLLVGVLLFEVNVGMGALAGAVILAILGAADHKSAVKNMPWSVIVMMRYSCWPVPALRTVIVASPMC